MKWISVILLPLLLSVSGCSKPESEQVVTFNSSATDEQVIIIHGLGRSSWSMKTMSELIEERGYQVCVVDYPTIRQSLDHTLDSSTQEIERCLAKLASNPEQSTNRQKVHFVGHSLGGLVIRSYLASHPRLVNSDKMGEVVFVGTPNQGSDVADFFARSWLLSTLGETAESLTTHNDSFPNQLPQPNYDFGVIAGTASYPLFNGLFDEPNDGLVSVNSTKLTGMKDFALVDRKHDRLRRDPHVTALIVNYISTGTFASHSLKEM
jgi:pimeloyl-ACP methyl ester carboxylesterase